MSGYFFLFPFLEDSTDLIGPSVNKKADDCLHVRRGGGIDLLLNDVDNGCFSGCDFFEHFFHDPDVDFKAFGLLMGQLEIGLGVVAPLLGANLEDEFLKLEQNLLAVVVDLLYFPH